MILRNLRAEFVVVFFLVLFAFAVASDFSQEFSLSQVNYGANACFPASGERAQASSPKDYSGFFIKPGEGFTNVVNLQFDFESEADAVVADELLDGLEANTILVTFFFTENFAKNFPDRVSKAAAKNHFIGLLVEEDVSGMSYEEQKSFFEEKLKAVESAFSSSKVVKVKRIKLKQLKQNADTYYALRDLEILQLTSLFGDSALCGIDGKEFEGECGYCKLVGGKITHVYPTVYGFWAVPITTIEKQGKDVPLSDEFLGQDFFEHVFEKYEKTIATEDNIALRFVTASLKASTYGKQAKKLQELTDRVFAAKGVVKAFHEDFTINAGGNHISQLSIVDYPDPVCGGQDDIDVKVSYTSTLYCPTYYFRTYGKYPSEANWQKLEEHSEYVSSGVHSFHAIVDLPLPSKAAEDDSTYEVIVLGQDCVASQGPCWPTPTSFQKKAEVSLKIPKLKPEVTGSAPYLGLGQYEGAFKGKVFRRGSLETLPRVEVNVENALSIPKGGKLVVDLYKSKTEKYSSRDKARRLDKKPFLNKLSETKYEGKWSDWKSSTGLWSKNEDIFVGEYEAQAKVLIGGKELCLSKNKNFWTIYNKPSSLGAGEQAAYLYDDSGLRDSKSIQYSRHRNRNNVIKKFLEWDEGEWALNPFNEHLFDITLAAVDGEKKEVASAEELMYAVANVIFYYSDTNENAIDRMYAGVSKTQFVAASNGVEAQLIRGQCLDYAHSLAAMYRGIGIPARVATGIFHTENFTYHQWSEAFFDKPPSGKDNWYTYDAMDYTDPHTPQNDLLSDAEGSEARKVARYGEDVFEVPVGRANWASDGGILWLNHTDKYLYRKNSQASDASFEKCEEKKYDTTSCTLPGFNLNGFSMLEVKPPQQTRVNDLTPINVFVQNVFANPLVAELNVSIYRFKSEDDGRDYANTGILGEFLESTVDEIIVPANSTIEKTYWFVIDDTAYPNDAYAVEAVLSNNSEQIETDFEIFDVVPGFDLTHFFPTVYENESFTATLQITNQLNATIQDIEITLEHPAYYQTQDSLAQNISSLAFGASVNFSWAMEFAGNTSEVERAFYFNATSGNAGSQFFAVNHRVIRTTKLDFDSSVQKIFHSSGQPFVSETKEISFFVQNNGDENATNVQVQLSLPQNASANPFQWAFSELSAGENKKLTTNITTFSNQDFSLGIAGSADQDSANASIPVFFLTVNNWLDSFDNSGFLNQTASQNISIQDGKIVLAEGASSGIAVSLPVLQETSSWETISWNSSGSNTSFMYVSNDGRDWTLVENGQDISFLDPSSPFYWKYELVDSGVFPELYEVTLVFSEKERFGAGLLGITADYGEDSNDAGTKYDYLVANVSVNITAPGTYYLEGHLYDNESNLVAVNVSNATFNATGVNQFLLKFMGAEVSSTGYDGVFTLDLLELYDENMEQIDFRKTGYTTAFYDHDDFEAYAVLQGYTKNSTGSMVGGIEVSTTGAAVVTTLSNQTTGFYSFKLLKGTYTVTALPEPFMNLRQSISTVALSSGEVRILNFSLPQAGSVAGRVVDENGRPVTDVYIFQDVFEPPQYSTNATGDYIVPFLSSGLTTIRIDEGEWYIFVEGNFATYGNRVAVNVTTGQTTQVDFTKQLPAGCTDSDGDGFYGNCAVYPDCDDSNNSIIGVKDNTYVNHDLVICTDAYNVSDENTDGIFIFNSSGVTLDCNGSTIRGARSGYGVYDYYGFDNITLKNCNIEQYDYGAYLRYVDLGLFENSIFTANDYYGIYAVYSYNNTFKNIVSKDNDYGLQLYYSNYNNIRDSVFTVNGVYGVFLSISHYNVLENIISTNNNNNGLNLYYSNYNNITKSTFNHSVSQYGLALSASNFNAFKENFVVENKYGIRTESSSANNTFFHNSIRNNTFYNFFNSHQNNVSAEYNWWGTADPVAIANSIYDYYDYGYYGVVDFEPFLPAPFNNEPSIEVSLFPMNATPDDDLVCSGLTSDLDGDVVSANYSVTYQFVNKTGSPVFRNYPNKQANCVYLGKPGEYNCTVLIPSNSTSPNQKITCEMTPYDGIQNGTPDSATLLIPPYAQRLKCGDEITKDTVLTENIFNCHNNGLIIAADNLTLDCNGFTITGNMPVSADASQAVYSGVLLQNRSGVTVKNCVVNDFHYGVHLDDHNVNNVLVNNTLERNSEGIHFYWYSENNTISGNNLNYNDYNGISLFSYSRYNTFVGNNIIANGASRTPGASGVYLYFHSDFNNFTQNRIIANEEYGIELYSDSKRNLFWQNVFSNNLGNAVEKAGSTDNYWNLSIVGNSWNDFEQNFGYPNYYDILGTGNGVDWHPTSLQ